MDGRSSAGMQWRRLVGNDSQASCSEASRCRWAGWYGQQSSSKGVESAGGRRRAVTPDAPRNSLCPFVQGLLLQLYSCGDLSLLI
jgi:hypothetical protein